MGWGASDWAPIQAAALPDLSQQPRARCLLPCPGAACAGWDCLPNSPLFIFPLLQCLEKFPVIQHFKFGSLLPIQPVTS